MGFPIARTKTSPKQVAKWQFYIGFGQVNGAAKQDDAHQFFGGWDYFKDTLVLESWDGSTKYTGKFDAPLTYTAIDSLCGVLTGTLTGTFKNVYLPKKWYTRSHGEFSLSTCAATDEFGSYVWTGGGSLTVAP